MKYRSDTEMEVLGLFCGKALGTFRSNVRPHILDVSESIFFLLLKCSEKLYAMSSVSCACVPAPIQSFCGRCDFVF